jgi:hypothetical protein
VLQQHRVSRISGQLLKDHEREFLGTILSLLWMTPSQTTGPPSFSGGHLSHLMANASHSTCEVRARF